jgi:arylsulfatase A-like enzyme
LPTVLDLAGLKKDDRFMGTSLLPLIQESTSKGRDEVFSITDPWMPQPQFAVRTQDWKWIEQENQQLVYDLKSDPQELEPQSTIPQNLKDAKKTYAQLIAETEQDRQKVEKRMISKEECARLEALGYTTCDQ